MREFFQNEYYDNTILEWLIAFGIIFGSVLVGKIVYWLCGGVVRKLTAKTRTKLDDIIVDMVEEPLVFAITLVGVWYGLSRLNLSETADSWIAGILQFLIVMCVAWVITRLADSLFKEFLAPLADKSETDLDDQLLPLARKATKIIVWSIAVIVAANNAGYNVGALIAGLGIGGLALAMAAKDTVSNVFGGFTVFTDRPFVVNDRVKILGFDGYIREIGVRSTRLQTLEGRMVTIPNSTFQDTAVENVTVEPTRKVPMEIGLTYDMSPAQMRRAMEILLEIAGAHDGLADDTKCAFTGFGDSAMSITFIYYIKKEADIMQTQTEINLAILDRFTAEGLDMAFPTQTIYTHKASA